MYHQERAAGGRRAVPFHQELSINAVKKVHTR